MPFAIMMTRACSVPPAVGMIVTAALPSLFLQNRGMSAVSSSAVPGNSHVPPTRGLMAFSFDLAWLPASSAWKQVHGREFSDLGHTLAGSHLHLLSAGGHLTSLVSESHRDLCIRSSPHPGAHGCNDCRCTCPKVTCRKLAAPVPAQVSWVPTSAFSALV